MNRRSIVWLALSLAALAALPILSVLAQSEIIRVIVGTVPGGAIDPYARMIAEHMSRTLGQPIIVENKPGASGTLAAEYVANAPADGTILWLGTQAFTEINPNAFPNARWSIDQFRPIIRGVEAPLAFIINPSVPAATFGEFITWTKTNRGKLSYSSYQAGTPSHFLGFQMNEKFTEISEMTPPLGADAGENTIRAPSTRELALLRADAEIAALHVTKPNRSGARHSQRSSLTQAPRLNRSVAGCATPTGSAGHAGATDNLKLTFHPDHSAGAVHTGKPDARVGPISIRNYAARHSLKRERG